MFVSLFSALAENPKDFSPFPAGIDRPAWNALPEELCARLIEKGDDALKTPWPVLSASDYLDFTKTGTRVFFEEKYFSRRRLLNDLVIAECAAGQRLYLDAVADRVWFLCEESGWQLPAHNAYIRDAVQIPLPDPNRPVLDLFACETAAGLAMIRHLLGTGLESAAPGITARLLWELDRRVITPYLNERFWWMGSGDERMCNWTPWCTQNLLLVAALTPLSDETRRMICRQAVLSLDYFLKDYDDDGCCDEGARYYGHAALCLFAAMEILNGMTDGFFAPLYKTEKIRNMADYIRQAHVADDYYINFADCPPILNPPGALEFLFGKRTENAALSSFAAAGARRRGLYEPSDDLSLHTRLTEFFRASEIEAYQAKPETPADRYFESVGMLITRDDRFCLAVKTGGNDDNHNHNDTGSVTLYSDGKPFLIDVGIGSYTRDTFSSRRYAIWTMQSAYHNLPTFAGIMQSPGADYRARDIHYSIGGPETSISFDIAGAYLKEAGVSHYRRSVLLKKGIGVRITDDYEGTHPAELSLMLCRRPVISGQSIQVPGRGEITIRGADAVRLEDIPITDPILLKSWPDVLFRLLITFSHKLGILITPAK